MMTHADFKQPTFTCTNYEYRFHSFIVLPRAWWQLHLPRRYMVCIGCGELRYYGRFTSC